MSCAWATLPIASNETKAVANSFPKYFMGSSTIVTSISEAVAANCLYSPFLAKRFDKQIKERALTRMIHI
jgi:hypothetical protein